MILFLRILVLLLGTILVIFTLFSAIRTLVLPRAIQDQITKFTFTVIRRMLSFLLRFSSDYQFRDRIMAYYAPVALLALLPVWLVLVMVVGAVSHHGPCGDQYLAGESGLSYDFASSLRDLCVPPLQVVVASLGYYECYLSKYSAHVG